MREAKLPRAARGPNPTHIYTLQETLALLRLPLSLEVRAALATAAVAGLRESQLTGLEWTDYRDGLRRL